MTEQEETRMPSVRARIAVFDSHSRDGGRNSDEGKDKENQTVTEKREHRTLSLDRRRHIGKHPYVLGLRRVECRRALCVDSAL